MVELGFPHAEPGADQHEHQAQRRGQELGGQHRPIDSLLVGLPAVVSGIIVIQIDLQSERGERFTGSIEQVYLSPLPSWLVGAGRVIAASVETLVVASGTYGIVFMFVPIRIDWNAAPLLPAAMVVVAGIGVSPVIAGATLVWKRIQMVNDTMLIMVDAVQCPALCR